MSDNGRAHAHDRAVIERASQVTDELAALDGGVSPLLIGALAAHIARLEIRVAELERRAR